MTSVLDYNAHGSKEMKVFSNTVEYPHVDKGCIEACIATVFATSESVDTDKPRSDQKIVFVDMNKPSDVADYQLAEMKSSRE